MPGHPGFRALSLSLCARVFSSSLCVRAGVCVCLVCVGVLCSLLSLSLFSSFRVLRCLLLLPTISSKVHSVIEASSNFKIPGSQPPAPENTVFQSKIFISSNRFFERTNQHKLFNLIVINIIPFLQMGVKSKVDYNVFF